MFQYKLIKVGVNDKEEEINGRLDELGKEGWELINFQPSSESHNVIGTVVP